jgi:hypothetical protein
MTLSNAHIHLTNAHHSYFRNRLIPPCNHMNRLCIFRFKKSETLVRHVTNMQNFMQKYRTAARYLGRKSLIEKKGNRCIHSFFELPVQKPLSRPLITMYV